MSKNLLFGALTIYAWLLATFLDPNAFDDDRASDPVVYALTVAPAILFILACLPAMVRPRFSKAALCLLLLAAIVTLFSIARADLATAISVGSLCAMLATLQQTGAHTSLRLINALFLLSMVACELMYSLGIGAYGLFPGQSVNDNVAWRVSLFAYNVTPSWLLSLVVLGLNYFHNRSRLHRVVMMLLALYFLVFSASRTGMIILALCASFLVCTRFIRFRDRFFYKAFVPMALVTFVVALNAEQLLVLLTGIDNPLLNSVLFKSSEGVGSVEEASSSIVRTLIWTTHLQLFADNPLLGHGTFVFTDVAPEFLQYNSRGSESFATGLLARIGAMALLFFYAVYLFAAEAARQADRLSFCLVILFSVTLLAYGSYIVPYDFIFLVLFGARNFSRGRAAPRQPQAALAASAAAREAPPRARHAPGS